MEKEEIIQKIREALAEGFEVDIEEIQPEAQMVQTLEMDSLDFVDMVVLIEKNFGFKVTAKDFEGVKTFSDLYGMILSRMNKEA